MDAVSFSYADKQAKRIKKIIADPDSTSGVLTVPKTIASGENITIPSGRVAVLPNVQIDGTLNVQGDVFIPSGATLSSVVEKVTSTDNAIVRFDGTTGKVQNSGVIIDDNNNVGIGIVPSAWSVYKALELGTTGNAILGATNSTVITNNAIFTSGAWKCSSGAVPNKFEVGNGDGTFRWFIAPSGTAGNAITWTNAMTLDASGNLLVGANTNGMNNTTGFNVTNPSTSAYCSIGHISGTISGAVYLNFSYNGTQIGSIYQSGTSSVVYATTSDYRLKENIRPADCKRFMDIKFVDYERIDGRHECGVIAHELQEIYPDLVTGEKDATEIRKVEISPAVEEVKDEDGNIIVEAVEAVYEEQEFPVYQQVNYMGLIARIGTVVQQQAKLIEAMRAEIDELKGIGGA